MVVGFNSYCGRDFSRPPRQIPVQHPRFSYSALLIFWPSNPSSPFTTITLRSNTSLMPLAHSSPRYTRLPACDVAESYLNYSDPVPGVPTDDPHVATPEIAQTRRESSLPLGRQRNRERRTCGFLSRLPTSHNQPSSELEKCPQRFAVSMWRDGSINSPTISI